MAHKKAGGSSRNGRDSAGKRLGLKASGGQLVHPGWIIVRQRGTEYYPGDNTVMGRDYTIHSVIEGTVKFFRGKKDKLYISVEPIADATLA